MSVAGSLATQSPGLQFFISATSRLLIVTAATSASVAGLLKTPSCVRVGVAAGPSAAAIGTTCHFVRLLRTRPPIEQRRHFAGQLGTADEHAHFGVLLERAGIEVDRADED